MNGPELFAQSIAVPSDYEGGSAEALLPLDAAIAWQDSQDPPAPAPGDAGAQARRDLTAALGQHRGHRVELHGADGAVLARGILQELDAHGARFRPALLEAGSPTVPLADITGVNLLQERGLVVMPRDRAVSLVGPQGWSLHGWTVASNTQVHSGRDTASYELVIADGAGRYYKAEYERPHDRSREPWEGDAEVVFEAAEQTTRLQVVTDYRLIHPDRAATAHSEVTNG